MEQFIDFFEEYKDARTLFLVIGLVIFWVIEGAVPLFSFQYRRVQHAALNLTLTFFQLLIALAMGLVMVRIADYTTANQFGLFYWLDLPLWLHVICAILLMDLFGGYLIHRIEHKIPLLWRFHIVHHADSEIDVTTGLRHHPGETVFRLSAQTLAVLIGGIPIGMIFLYSMISLFFAQWTHSNIRSPEFFDKWLSYIIVTPNHHKVHHHESKPLTDTNFGNIFMMWDRLFGTFNATDPSELKYGIDSLPSQDDKDSLKRMLMIPFDRQAK
jgi:sterol desaturase/sphingolipid hydroxylase (fatty acid hydroxylase superfamily)